MSTVAERAAARRHEALKELADFPQSLFLPLIRIVREDLDLVLSDLDIATEMELLSGLCAKIVPDYYIKDRPGWEVWQPGPVLGGNPSETGFLFETDGTSSLLLKVRGSRTSGHATRIQYTTYGENKEKYSITPERGLWYAQGHRFIGAGDDKP